MGTVLDLRLRQPASGDWTSLERSQLYALVDQLPHDPDREVILGVTDAGDPWFVVMSGSDEVELHVARIGGRFVVHRGDEDQVSEAPDLWTAAARAGGLGLPERRATVTSLFGDPLPVHALAALEHQSFQSSEDLTPPSVIQAIASVAPAAEIIALAAIAPEAEARALPVALEADRPAVLADEAPAPRAPVEAPMAAPAVSIEMLPPPVFVAADTLVPENAAAPIIDERFATVATGGETLVGTAGWDTLVGGEGDDSVTGGGAGEGGFDLMDGRGGDDTLMLDGAVVAVGGRGQDGFYIVSHTTGAVANNLGIVLDFFQSRDDRLEFEPGSTVRVVGVTREADVLAAVRGAGLPKDSPIVPGARVALDLDDDGRPDGYVLLANTHGVQAGRGGLHWNPLQDPPPPPEEAYDQFFANNALVGMEARAGGHGPAPVLTAYQMGPGFFPDQQPGTAQAAGLLRPEDLAPPSVDLFG